MVVTVHAVHDTKSMPANKAVEVIAHTKLGEPQSFFTLVHGEEHEALDGHRLTMLWCLGQDGVCCFHSQLVFLRLILLNQSREQRTLTRA